MPTLQKQLFPIFIFVLAGLLTGCSASARKARHEKNADAFYAAGQYAQAEIEYLNILRLDQNNAHALRQLGLLYHDNGRTVRAIPFLKKSLELNPDDPETLLKLGAIYLSGGEIQKARDSANAVLSKSPHHETAPLLLAESAKTEADLRNIRQQLQSLTQQIGETPGLNIALGTLLLRDGKINEAQLLVRRALNLNPKSSAAHQTLGMIFWAQNDITNATAEFKAATDLAEPRSPLRLQYARFLIATGNVEKGKQVLTELTKNAPDYLPPWIALGEMALTQHRFAEATSDVAETLARDPEYYDALLLSGRLKLASGEADKAILELDRLAAVYSRSPAVHYYLGMAYLQKDDSPRALAQFDEAVRLNPEFDEAVLQQAQVNIRRANVPAAVAALNDLLKRRPQLLPAYYVLAQAQLAKGNLKAALTTYTRAAELFPQNLQVLLLMGTVLQQQGNSADARKIFEKALAIEPNYLPALEQLINLDLAAKRSADAEQRVQQQLAQEPNSPELYALLGRIYLDRNDTTQAEQVLLKAVQLNPEYLPAYRFLAQVYIAAKKDQQALEKLATILASKPTDSIALLQVGLIQTGMKNFAAARDAYEKLLGANPRSSVALNNLAYLYSEHLGQLDKAYQAAQKARELLPENPAAADTLGWILYQRGEYPWALSLLQASADKLPGEGEVLFHLGMTHYVLGNEEAARTFLQRAVNSSKDFTGKDEANQRLSILNINIDTADTKTVTLLESRLAENPDDFMALLRLARIYERDKSTDKAVKLYQRALDKNPANVFATMRLAQLYSEEFHDVKKAMQFARTARALAPNDPEIAQTLGRLAYQSGEFAWALGLLQESQQPQNPESLYYLALCLCSVGRVADAESTMRSALETKTPFAQAGSAQRFLAMVSLYQHPERAPESINAVQQALKENPHDLPALAVNGLIQQQRGDSTAAKATYELILRHYPLFSPATRRLALLYSEAAGDSQKAYDYAVKARASFPEDPELAKALGLLTYARGDYARAVQLLKESAARLPQDADLFFHLGLAQNQLKQKTEAQEALRQALALKLNSKSAQEANRILTLLK